MNQDRPTFKGSRSAAVLLVVLIIFISASIALASNSGPTAQLDRPSAEALNDVTCIDPIVNGGFEQRTGWVTKATEYTAGYAEDPEPVRSGEWSMRTGIVNPDHNKYSYSSAIQAVNIPSNTEYMKLNFWIYPQTGEDESIPLYLPKDPLNIQETDAINVSDWQFVFILNKYGYELERLLYRRQNADAWQFFSFDLPFCSLLC